MAKNQKSYTPEFKQQIVDLYHTGGYSDPKLEREYGVGRSTISGWIYVKKISYWLHRFRGNSTGNHLIDKFLEKSLHSEGGVSANAS